jgi:hypothetical protein
MFITEKSPPFFARVKLKGDYSSEFVGLKYLNIDSGFLKISLGPINPLIAL